MTIHAIQTGSVRIKRSQVRGSGHGMRRRLRVFTDPEWTDWIPTYAWLIDRPEGIIVVDTGQGRPLLHNCALWASGRATCNASCSPTCVSTTMGDWRTFRIVRSSRPGENCTLASALDDVRNWLIREAA